MSRCRQLAGYTATAALVFLIVAGVVDARQPAPPRRPPDTTRPSPPTHGAQPRQPEKAEPARRPPPRALPAHPGHAPPASTVRGRVFIGGYFYDPFFGPYPWWTRRVYPYWYFPMYDTRAYLRLRVEPDEAA